MDEGMSGAGGGARMTGRWMALAAVCLLAGCDVIGGKESSNSTAPSQPAAQSPAASPAPNVPVATADIMATVNGTPITKQEVELRIEELRAMMASVGQPWQPLGEQELQALLDEMVQAEIMAQKAVATGVESSTDAQRRWRYLRRQFLAQEWLRKQQEELKVAPSQVELFYEQNRQGFREPERIHVREIVVGSESEAKQALSRLLDSTASFEALAQQISVAPTAADGGLISQWVMRTAEKQLAFPSEQAAEEAGVVSLDPVAEAAAFAIDRVHGLSSYVKGADGKYHIFQLAERQESRERPLSEVWDAIQGNLMFQDFQKRLDDMTKQATIERFPDRLGGVVQ